MAGSAWWWASIGPGSETSSQRQRHVGLAVAFNTWQYYQATGDVAWLAHRGADLIIEVARLFAALATYDPPEDRFHIDTVMGPDEYHDGYPDAPGQGLRDKRLHQRAGRLGVRPGHRRPRAGGRTRLRRPRHPPEHRD